MAAFFNTKKDNTMGNSLIEKYRKESRKEAVKYPDLAANPKKKWLDDDYDAFRHIYSSAAVAYDYARSVAWLADLREHFSESNSAAQIEMDLHNNQLGREIGENVKSREEISLKVYQAIKTNQHIRLTPPQEKATNSEIQNDSTAKIQEEGQYIWRTSRDDKVRHEHAVREGKVFSWNTSPEGGHPGEAYGCRCMAEPYPSETTPHLEKIFNK